ncbi:MAG: hypothetical protein EP335_13030 [Alphaproteobacteria bacterium]|nr:MAG: hypothetical protein EP335_13030 [Alphaproteobacteria bacterium]
METSPATRLTADPTVYPFQVDWLKGRAWMLHVPEAWYQNAAFLDQRALAPDARGDWMPLSALEDATRGATRRPLGLIFHIGHCGSTLISRALGLSRAFFSLREPLPLRDIASFYLETDAVWAPMSPKQLDARLDLFRTLWARTPDDRQIAIVKATSFCSVLAGDWLARYANDRAVMLAMAPEIYIATVLGAETYVNDLKGGARVRMAGLAAAVGTDRLQPLYELSPGEIAAMTYMAELINLHRGAVAAGPRALRLDFDQYLKDPGAALSDMTAHFGARLPDADIVDILNHPLLGRYSKATDYQFTGFDRRQRLAESRAANGAEIKKGITWLRRFARDHDLGREALLAYGYAK